MSCPLRDNNAHVGYWTQASMDTNNWLFLDTDKPIPLHLTLSKNINFTDNLAAQPVWALESDYVGFEVLRR
jgi:hypothetical protein